MSQPYKGSCLCGGIRFEAESFVPRIANCHCTMCRKFHGAAFGTLVRAEGLRWLSGQALLQDYVGHNGTVRTFCRECGSSLGFRVKGAAFEQLEIALGAFDDELPVKVDAHIYTDYKACWYDISDTLPQYGEGRTG
ncbi:glutathione-dependent formaldehyde-activating GFA [Pokkaliibacter plantistimulans]|uniref:Glutathione-dependent formaldehyde-activating GFA n=1 Tax=Proteobacteria bacterium 228 TaxID=2083153 RepID=A0A2S5KT25_9PROT|nr:GFA family protein [Pokkaliibacter plantistimulans]PPC77822.1 glutathione-dependent formaldehyde-activating GFA [Pokkaliibacter plantistimulans]